MVTFQTSTPIDLCESSIGNKASGFLFLLLAGVAFFLAWGELYSLDDR